MNKFKLLGLKKRNTNLQQANTMTMDKLNFQVPKGCLIKKNKLMMFRGISLQLPPSPQRILSTRWTRLFVQEKEKTLAHMHRGRELWQRRGPKWAFNGESSFLLYITVKLVLPARRLIHSDLRG